MPALLLTAAPAARVIPTQRWEAPERMPELVTASWYGPGFEGRLTASGERFDPRALTCASRTEPFGTVLHLSVAGRQCDARVNDRGPWHPDRALDVSAAVADALGMKRAGVAILEVRR